MCVLAIYEGLIRIYVFVCVFGCLYTCGEYLSVCTKCVIFNLYSNSVAKYSDKKYIQRPEIRTTKKEDVYL